MTPRSRWRPWSTWSKDASASSTSMPDATPSLPRGRLAVACATVGGIGLLRPGPGTWASVAAAVVAVVPIALLPVALITPVLAAGVVLATVLGLVSAPAAIRHFALGDPAPVVIDEVAGTWLAIALVPASTLAVA